MSRVELNINLNRVEGDLEIALTLEEGVVAEARTVGTLYRGFEQIMVGRTPRDAAVITPRVCGICGTTGRVEPLDQNLINEHVRHSWFCLYEGGRHPWVGETIPDFQPNSDRYTWAKAPRYGDNVVQTGPLAELLIAGDALIASLNATEGGNAWLRQFARVRRIAYELVYARRMLDELAVHMDEPHFLNPPKSQETDGEGYGLVMAARGALGHWVRIKDGLVEKYQIVTPTAWNASPRDSTGQPGHWEQSLVGLAVENPDDPVEIGHIIRSHDPCLVCTVHMPDTGKRVRFTP